MQIHPSTLSALADQLAVERKRQGLSREQAASVCNVSVSFIRDAETSPGRCSLDKLLHLALGLGLSVSITGWQSYASAPSQPTVPEQAT